MIFTKHRFEIWNQTQHPYKHTLGDFSYVNPAAPGVSNVEGAFNWIFAVLYPNAKSSVANVAALPLAGNTLNDYRVVLDDGDGKAASYRWEQREGEVSASWHKVYDMDWGQDSILAAFQNNTQDLYVWRNGRTELDGSGSPITGLYAGQTIYGGDSANQNLTLKANSGDGTGPRTGFVQVDDNFRPAIHNTFDLGTSSFRWKDIYAQSSAVIDTLSISNGEITDSGGAISFGSNQLTTTGDIYGSTIIGSTALKTDTGADSVTLVPGSYTDTTGAVSFGAAGLSTTGTLGAGVATFTDNGQTIIISPDVTGLGQITSSTGTISFDNENLQTTGNIQAGQITGTRLDIDSIRLDSNTISVTLLNSNLILQANGTGVVDVQSAMSTLGQTVTGTLGVTGQFNIDNIRIDGNVISSTNLDGNINLHPNGTGHVNINANIHPNNDNTRDLGETANRWNDLFLGGVISNGTNNIAISTLLAFRSGVYRDLAQTLPAQAGDSLFYDSVNSVWLASAPDTEITHAQLTGLTSGDAGHTQFAMLAGRAGGQTLQGGTAASESLILESTSNATKGSVLTKDNFTPFTNASFSGSWSGTDLGDSTHYFRDLYTKGELKGARLENYTFATLPAASVQNIGRVVFATDVNKAYVDVGTSFKVLGVSKFVADQSFDGIVTLKDVNVSAEITDARNAQWQLRDNANNFEIMYVTILATSVSNVRITTNVPLPAGSYRLIGVE
jgi:hypothetical protein